MVTFTWMLGIVWLLLALLVAVLWGFWRRHIDHEPPSRRARRRQIRALREIGPLTPVWPEPVDPRRGHP